MNNRHTLFDLIENHTPHELLRVSYAESCKSGAGLFSEDGFLHYANKAASGYAMLNRRATRSDAIVELKHNIVMYQWLYDNLADDSSRDALVDIMSYRLYADPKFLNKRNERYPVQNARVLVDCGGNGSTAASWAREYTGCQKIYYFEPDSRVYAKGREAFRRAKNIVPRMNGAFSHAAAFKLSSGSPGTFVALDDAIGETIDMIKLDCDGMELYAVEGMRRHIQSGGPVLHVNVDSVLDLIWQVPYRICSLNPSYAFRLVQDMDTLYITAAPEQGLSVLDAPCPESPKLSVLTCAYNTPERLIRRAIESILHQTYRNFEYIIVDNGCTDGTGDIIREYARSDSRIRLIRLEKNDLLEAWNKLLSQAKCEYFAVLDSDDQYEPHFLGVMVDAMQKTNSDLIACGTRSELDSDPYCNGIRTNKDAVVSKQTLGEIWPDVFGNLSSIWAKLYKLSLYHSIRPEKNAGTGNDTYYNLLYLRSCGNVCFVQNALHRYTQPEGSASRGFDTKALEREKVIFSEYSSFLESIDAWTPKNRQFVCHVFLGGIRRSLRYTVDAAQTPSDQRILFLQGIVSDAFVYEKLSATAELNALYLSVIASAAAIAAQSAEEHPQSFLYRLSRCPYFTDPNSRISEKQMESYVCGITAETNVYHAGLAQFPMIFKSYSAEAAALLLNIDPLLLICEAELLTAIVRKDLGSVVRIAGDCANRAAALIAARAQILLGNKANALDRLLSLAQNGDAPGRLALDAACGLLKEHRVLSAYSGVPWLCIYPEIVLSAYENDIQKARDMIAKLVKSGCEVETALFDLLLTMGAVDDAPDVFIYAKKLRLHYEVIRRNYKSAELVAEELNELCPTDRMTIYYSLHLLVRSGQLEDAAALSEAALRYYEDDPLFRLPSQTDAIPPFLEDFS